MMVRGRGGMGFLWDPESSSCHVPKHSAWDRPGAKVVLSHQGSHRNHLHGLCSTLRDSASPDLGQQPKRGISSKFPGVAAVLLDQGPLSENPWAKGFTRTNSLNSPKDTLSKMRTALPFKSYRPELEFLLYQKSWKVTIFGGQGLDL